MKCTCTYSKNSRLYRKMSLNQTSIHSILNKTTKLYRYEFFFQLLAKIEKFQLQQFILLTTFYKVQSRRNPFCHNLTCIVLQFFLAVFSLEYDGRRRALVMFNMAYSSQSSCLERSAFVQLSFVWLLSMLSWDEKKIGISLAITSVKIIFFAG